MCLSVSVSRHWRHFAFTVARRRVRYRCDPPPPLPVAWRRDRAVVADPDVIRRSAREASARLFSRWYTDLRHGRHSVVVVLSERGDSARHWIVTAYTARRLAAGEIEWHRS